MLSRNDAELSRNTPLTFPPHALCHPRTRIPILKQQALVHNRVLRVLDVSVNRLQAGGALVLLNALGSKQRVASLNLGGNEMLAEGAVYVARAIRTLPTLTALELEGNHFNCSGAEAIAQSPVDNESLRSLGLARNEIAAKGATLIAHALVKNVTLRSIDLSENKVNEAGLRGFATALLEGAAVARSGGGSSGRRGSALDGRNSTGDRGDSSGALASPMAGLGEFGVGFALSALVLDDPSVSSRAQAQFIFALAPLRVLRRLDLGQLAFVYGRADCATFIMQPLTHAIHHKFDLLASTLIDCRNAGRWEKEEESDRHGGNGGLGARKFGVLCGRLVFRDASGAEIHAPSEHDAADAVHALLASSRDRYPLIEKQTHLRHMLGDDAHAGLVQNIPVPSNLWVHTPDRHKLLMGGTRIETVIDLWGLDRLRPCPRAVVPKIENAPPPRVCVEIASAAAADDAFRSPVLATARGMRRRRPVFATAHGFSNDETYNDVIDDEDEDEGDCEIDSANGEANEDDASMRRAAGTVVDTDRGDGGVEQAASPRACHGGYFDSAMG